MSTVASAFERATAVEPLGAGAWCASCDGAWTTYLGVSGGFIAALDQATADGAAGEERPADVDVHQ